MLFNSIQFVAFFVVVTTLYYLLPYRYRWILLLGASCYFYMAFVPIYILILGFTIVVDYFAGIFIEKAQGPRRKAFLICSIIANVGVLAVFKYYNFLTGNLNFLMHGFGLKSPLPYLSILLPIGLSFHTFQAMSYTIEVYRGKYKAERHFGMYSLYVMFYPQLVAGPIERPQNLLPQLKLDHPFEYDNVTSGLRLMAWGFFKKVVIADRLAVVCDRVYRHPHHFDGISFVIATFFFAYQIYCDFSGYSDIAIGAARVMGIKLMRNFNNPYQSKSFRETWTRWHISLSTWLRDYIFNPLGGYRKGIPRGIFNIFIVFLIFGLWHGPKWTYIAMGAIQAIYLTFEILTRKPRKYINTLLKLDKVPFVSMIVIFIFVNYSFIFFKANTISDAFYIARHVFDAIPELIHFDQLQYMGMTNPELVFSVALIIFLEGVQYLDEHYLLFQKFITQPVYIRWAFYYIALFMLGVYGVYGYRQFIYFQF